MVDNPCNKLGQPVCIKLEREDNLEPIEVEIPTGLYRKLALTAGESLVVRPRKMQVFLDPRAGAALKSGDPSISANP